MGKCGTLLRDSTDNISNTKTQQVFHMKSVFAKLGLVTKITTSTKTQQGEKSSKNQEKMICQQCKGLSSPQRCDQVTHLRAPLDSTPSNLKPGLPLTP